MHMSQLYMRLYMACWLARLETLGAAYVVGRHPTVREFKLYDMITANFIYVVGFLLGYLGRRDRYHE